MPVRLPSKKGHCWFPDDFDLLGVTVKCFVFGEPFAHEVCFALLRVTEGITVASPSDCLFLQEAALCRQLPMEAETLATVQAAVNPPPMTQDMRSITNNSSDPFLNG